MTSNVEKLLEAFSREVRKRASYQGERDHRVVEREAFTAALDACGLEVNPKGTGEDAKRLDFLDEANKRLNAHYGTNYGWRLVMNHNVNRLFLRDINTLDLHDSMGGHDKQESCRGAIDSAMRKTAAARRATLREEG